MEFEEKPKILQSCKKEEDEMLGYLNESPVCFACLAKERKVCRLGPYLDIVRQICNVSEIDKKFIALCWECMALVKKVAIFKEKFEKAQEILAKFESTSQCLSTLVIENINNEMTETVIHSDTEDIILKENSQSVEIKEEIKELEGKPESDNDNNYSDECSTGIPDFVEPALSLHNLGETKILKVVLNKIEEKAVKNLTNISKWPEKKTNNTFQYKRSSKPYQFIPKNKNNDNYIIKEKINPDDINDWIDEERNSRYFRMLPVKNKCDKCVSAVDCKLNHEKLHNQTTGLLNCAICDTYFSNEDLFSKHVLNHYFIHKCIICKFRCYSRSQMDHHLKFHNQRVHCLECGAGFNKDKENTLTTSKLREHKHRVGMELNVREFYTHHKDLHTKCICDICNKKCNTKEGLIKHMRQHMELYCKICKLTFKRHRIYQSHMKAQHTEKPGEEAFCVKCNKQFRNYIIYRRHCSHSIAHADERKPRRPKPRDKLTCPVCNNVYTRPEHMRNHYRFVHLKVSDYFCTDCNRYFLTQTRYSEHRKYTHEGVPKKKDKFCTVCGRGFSEKRILINHMRTHTGEKPYGCPHCDARFTQKQAMQSHVKFIHLKNKRKPAGFT